MIDVKIRRYDFDYSDGGIYPKFRCEVEGPVNRVGNINYIIQKGVTTTVSANYFRASYDLNNNLDEIKEKFLSHYPEEIREYIIFGDVEKIETI